jgi:hypothetical protein
MLKIMAKYLARQNQYLFEYENKRNEYFSTSNRSASPRCYTGIYYKNIHGFRKGISKEKDVVCEYDDSFSFEIKTSSQRSIYGNRSYAKSDTGKDKSGYYLTINFEKIFANKPKILLIKMGWLNHLDWVGQKSETGQQASLIKQARKNKLIVLYKARKQ